MAKKKKTLSESTTGAIDETVGKVKSTAGQLYEGVTASKPAQAVKKAAGAAVEKVRGLRKGAEDAFPEIKETVVEKTKPVVEKIQAATGGAAGRANQKVKNQQKQASKTKKSKKAAPESVNVSQEAVKRQRAKDTGAARKTPETFVNDTTIEKPPVEPPKQGFKERMGNRLKAPIKPLSVASAGGILSNIAADVSDVRGQRTLRGEGSDMLPAIGETAGNYAETVQGVGRDLSEYGPGYAGRQVRDFVDAPGNYIADVAGKVPGAAADVGRGIVSTIDQGQAGLRAGIGQLAGETAPFGEKFRQYQMMGDEPSGFMNEFNKPGVYSEDGQPVTAPEAAPGLAGGAPAQSYAPGYGTMTVNGKTTRFSPDAAPTSAPAQGLRAAAGNREFVTGLDVANQGGVKFNDTAVGNIARFNTMNKIAKGQNQAAQLGNEADIASGTLAAKNLEALTNAREAQAKLAQSGTKEEREQFKRQDEVRDKVETKLSEYDQLIDEGSGILGSGTKLQKADNIKQSSYTQALESAFNPNSESSALAGQFLARDVQPVMSQGFLGRIGDAISSDLVSASDVFNNAGDVQFNARSMSQMRIQDDGQGNQIVMIPVPTKTADGQVVNEYLHAFSMDNIEDPRTLELLRRTIPKAEKRTLASAGG